MPNLVSGHYDDVDQGTQAEIPVQMVFPKASALRLQNPMTHERLHVWLDYPDMRMNDEKRTLEKSAAGAVTLVIAGEGLLLTSKKCNLLI